mgnify:CR=1 FL=1
MDGWMHACMHGDDLFAWIDKIDHACHRYIINLYICICTHILWVGVGVGGAWSCPKGGGELHVWKNMHATS